MTTEDLIKRDMKYTSVNGVSIEEYVNKNYIHKSVIEDIKAEIEEELSKDNHSWYKAGMEFCLEIINKYIESEE